MGGLKFMKAMSKGNDRFYFKILEGLKVLLKNSSRLILHSKERYIRIKKWRDMN